MSPYSGLTGNLPRDPASGALLVAGYGIELGYAEITAASSVVTASTPTAVTGLSTTVTVGARPVMVRFYGVLANAHATAALTGHAAIFRDGVLLNDGFATWSASSQFQSKVVPCEARDAPATGSHTYDIRIRTEGTGSTYVNVITGARAFVRVEEC